MKLFYFSQENLKNSLFIKEFVSAYHQVKGKALLVHAPFGSLPDTRFVTKRISSVLSEVLIVNNSISGDQKKVLQVSPDGSLDLRRSVLDRQFQMVDLVVMNPIAQGPEGPILVDGLELVRLLRTTFETGAPVLFTRNTKSPLTRESVEVEQATDIAPLLELYEEEKTALENALALAPAVISTPQLLGKEPAQ